MLLVGALVLFGFPSRRYCWTYCVGDAVALRGSWWGIRLTYGSSLAQMKAH